MKFLEPFFSYVSHFSSTLGNLQSVLFPVFHPVSQVRRADYRITQLKEFHSSSSILLPSITERELSPPLPDPAAATFQDHKLVSCRRRTCLCVVDRPLFSVF